MIKEHVRVETEAGSIYEFQYSKAGWWVKGNNITNPYSLSLGEKWWQINPPKPWPPMVGQRLWFSSFYVMEAIDHPERMSGGGKDTSPVKKITFIQDKEQDDEPS